MPSAPASIPRPPTISRRRSISIPICPSARLYLATAYMSQYVPGSETPENRRNADSALEEFQKVLKTESARTSCSPPSRIASLYYNMKDFAKAEEWNKKVIEIDPKNKEAYYTLGVIAWTQFVAPDREARVAQSMKPEDPGPLKAPKNEEGSRPSRPISRPSTGRRLTDGIEDEKKALADRSGV